MPSVLPNNNGFYLFIFFILYIFCSGLFKVVFSGLFVPVSYVVERVVTIFRSASGFGQPWWTICPCPALTVVKRKKEKENPLKMSLLLESSKIIFFFFPRESVGEFY